MTFNYATCSDSTAYSFTKYTSERNAQKVALTLELGKNQLTVPKQPMFDEQHVLLFRDREPEIITMKLFAQQPSHVSYSESHAYKGMTLTSACLSPGSRETDLDSNIKCIEKSLKKSDVIVLELNELYKFQALDDHIKSGNWPERISQGHRVGIKQRMDTVKGLFDQIAEHNSKVRSENPVFREVKACCIVS